MIAHDIRGTLRLMRSQPVLSSAIVLMLALGIGATTAIFSVVYSVLLKPLPFPDPDRIVQVSGALTSRGWTSVSLTEANFWDLHERNRTLSEFGILSFESFTLIGTGEPERVSGGAVTTGFFRALGVRPVAGRLFETGEDLPGAAAASCSSGIDSGPSASAATRPSSAASSRSTTSRTQ